jgi:hypothetical protein
MSWSKVIIGGVVGGIALNVADFVMHGIIMSPTYMKYTDVFSQEQANPLWFTLVAVCIGVAAAILFGKSRASWAEGWSGGATFGFCIGLIAFFPPFYDPLVIAGFPYYLAWCWGGINMIGFLVLGTVLGLIVKKG